MDLFLFNDLKRTGDSVDINHNFGPDDDDNAMKKGIAELNRQMSAVIYPNAAVSLMLRLCRPEVREFHKTRQIVKVNPTLFNESQRSYYLADCFF